MPAPSPSPSPPPLRDVAEELRDLAVAVRRIGCGYRTTPEAIAIAKDDISRRLRRVADAVQRHA